MGVFYHSLWLPVRHGGVGLNGGTFPQQVCADRGDACREAVTQQSDPACPLRLPRDPGTHTPTWQVFADDVGGFYCAGHGGMYYFIKLQPQARKSETS